MSRVSPSKRTAGRTKRFVGVLLSLFAGGFAFADSGAAVAAGCTGPGAPTGSPWVCVTAIAVPGKPLASFDISWVNPTRSEYYLADRSNAAVDVVSTTTNTFITQIGGFVGATLGNPATNTLNNAKSGPDGLVAHGKWLYVGDGDSTLKIIDLTVGKIVQSVSTGGSFRVDEMAITTDGKLLLAANNADDPPFATLFGVNGDNATNNISIISKINVDPSIIPPGLGLSMEQPGWDPVSRRFYVSIPQINYPPGCTPSSTEESPEGNVPCQGGLLAIDPSAVTTPTYTFGAYDRARNIGVLPLPTCGPNGLAVGPQTDAIGSNLLLGCTPANMPDNTGTLVINTNTMNFSTIGGVTGSDEVWYNPGDGHYYTGSSANRADLGGPVLGIIDATSNILVSTIPSGSGSHSVAADPVHNFIYVPQVVPFNPNLSESQEPGSGAGDKTGNSKQTCGSNNGCIAVYQFTKAFATD